MWMKSIDSEDTWCNRERCKAKGTWIKGTVPLIKETADKPTHLQTGHEHRKFLNSLNLKKGWMLSCFVQQKHAVNI